MLGLLSAVKTETIIGIVAIVVIVISVGIIVATAIRNYLLHKKMKETSSDDDVVVIDVDAQNVDEGEIGDDLDTHAAITEEDEKEALQTDGIEEEFGDEAPDEEEILQEINLEDANIDENGKIADDVMANAKVEDNSMAELLKKMSGDNDWLTFLVCW